MGGYNITAKMGQLILTLQPWLIALVILYLVAVGIGCAISEKVRSMSQPLFIGGFIGLAVAFGAKPIGEALGGVFMNATMILRALL